MDKQQFWQKEFGNRTTAIDFAGREIHKDAFGTNSRYSWDVDHIRPLSCDGTNTQDNMQIVHMLTNDEKGDNYPTFRIDKTLYQVKKKKNASPSEWANGYDYSDKKYCIVKL